MSKAWSEVNAIYQIYPRSFMDNNDDGVGDIRGIIDKLDYLKGQEDSLGVDSIWLSPFYPSPMTDFGYDVSDYKDVHPMFGTLDDFRELIEKAHDHDINVMIDFVPNHTSDQHPWFQESKSSRDNPKRDYYKWADPKPDGTPPNNWLSIFGGSVWEFDEASGQYYLHTFLKEQPDLNWDNPQVREEMKQILRFWFDMGVDGVRADAVRWISKGAKLKDDPKNPHFKNLKGDDPFYQHLPKNSQYGKNLFTYLREMTDVVEEYPNRIMIFEDNHDGFRGGREQYLDFYNINPRVSMPFNFEGLGLPFLHDEMPFVAEYYRNFIDNFQNIIVESDHVPVYCFSNHDNHRIVTRVGQEQARLVALLQLTLPGLPVIYYGDELGMPNGNIEPEDVRDPVELRNPGIDMGRDPERTPMEWSDEAYAGFSRSKPWLPVTAGFEKRNVRIQSKERDSFWTLYRSLLRLRSDHPVLYLGKYQTVKDDNKQVFTFFRYLENERVYVMLNFSKEPARVTIPRKGRLLCSTHPNDAPEAFEDGIVWLRPFEAMVIDGGESLEEQNT